MLFIKQNNSTNQAIFWLLQAPELFTKDKE